MHAYFFANAGAIEVEVKRTADYGGPALRLMIGRDTINIFADDPARFAEVAAAIAASCPKPVEAPKQVEAPLVPLLRECVARGL